MHCVRMVVDRQGPSADGSVPCHGLLPVKTTDPDIRIEVVQCSMLVGSSGYSMIKITDLSGTHEKQIMDDSWKQDSGEYSVSKIGSRQYISMVVNNRCRLACIIAESGCFLTSSVPAGDYRSEWTIVGPTSGHIHMLMNRLRDLGYNVEFLSSHSYTTETMLTPKQEDIIRYAYDRGYYDIPKKIKVDDIAKGVGCNKSTANVMLRTAENKIIASYVSSATRDRRESKD